MVDKGALDALMGEAGAEGAAQGAALLAECCRVAHPSRGAVAVVSLLQDHVLEALLHTFRAGWRLSIQQVPPSRDMLTSPLQPFFVLARAAADVAHHGGADADAAPYPAAVPPAAVEFAVPPSGGAGGAGRVINAEQLRDVALLVARENAARAAGTAHGVRHSCVQSISLALLMPCVLQGSPPGGDPFRALQPGQRVVVPLGAHGADGTPRFLATVIDSPPDAPSLRAMGAPPPPARPAAIFLVPQGREHEWLFGSPEGQRALAASAGAARLCIIAFGRGHTFGDAAAVQAELSPLVLPLAPADARAAAAAGAGPPIPYLTTSEGIGARTAVAAVDSALSGRILVEEVALEGGGSARRMVFASNPNLVQSEVRLLKSGDIDTHTLACDYHTAIVAGLAVAVPKLASNKTGGDDATVMVVGLGGGALPSFMAAHLRCSVQVVELDADVAAMAAAHFGFAEGPRLSLHVGCGLAAVAAAAPASLDALLVDAGSGDASLAMTCPPPPFLEPPFLQAAAAALRPGGALVMNLVTRSPGARDAALAALRTVFPVLLLADEKDEHVNRVVFALSTPPEALAAGPASARAAAAALRASAAASFDADLDLEALAEGMRALTLPGELDALD